MRTIKLLITLVLLGLSYNSFAQCAYGIPNNPGCIPPTHWYPQGSYQAPAPQKRWVKTWGAIAIDTSSPKVTFAGTSVGEDSKRKAIAAAIKSCKSNGGGENCRSVVEYHNQCVAFAQGDGGAIVSNAETIELAAKNALALCSKRHPECEIIHTECTEPYVK